LEIRRLNVVLWCVSFVAFIFVITAISTPTLQSLEQSRVLEWIYVLFIGAKDMFHAGIEKCSNSIC